MNTTVKALLKVVLIAAAAGALQGVVEVIPEPYKTAVLAALAYILPSPLKKNAPIEGK